MNLNVLLVDDSDDDAKLIEITLRKGGFDLSIVRVEHEATFREEFLKDHWDIIISDYYMPGFSGKDVVRIAKTAKPDLPLIVMSGVAGEQIAVEMLKLGADNYILKSQMHRLVPEIQRELKKTALIKKQRSTETAFRDTHHRLTALVESAMDAIVSVDEQYNVVYFNPSAEKIFGYTSDEVIGKPLDTLIPPRYAERHHRHIERFGQNGHAPQPMHSIETIYGKRWDGSEFPIEASISMAIVNNQKILTAILRDVTDKIKSEEAIKLRNTALDSAANTIIITDKDGHIIWANSSFTRLTGYQTAEAIGKNPRILKSGKHDDTYYASLWETILSGQVWRGEITNKRKDGSFYEEELSITPVKNQNGAISHFIAFKQDITERKKTENQIRYQANLLDQAPDAIIVRDLNHHVTYWNKGAEKIYGWTKEEILGQSTLETAIFGDQKNIFLTAFDRLLKDGQWQGEIKHQTKDKRLIDVLVRWALMYDAQGQPESVLVINTDISEQKKIEAQFLRSQRLESIGFLASGIAHDLNNLLSAMSMSSQVLRRKLNDPSLDYLVDTIDTSVRRSTDIVRQILAFSKGQHQNSHQIIQIRHILKEMENIINETFPKSIQFRNMVTKDAWDINGDMTQIHQVLMNLCVNARDAMPHGGILSIAAENITLDEAYIRMNPEATAGAHLVLKISDTGTGIPAEIQDKVFEPFYSTKPVGAGTGLGLSTVQTIVRNHKGFIKLYSEPGRGTQFSIYFPASTYTFSDAEKQMEALPHGQGQMLLLVDDEVSVRKITKIALEGYGYRVVTAADGSEAVAEFARNGNDIKAVILDMMMPIMDGSATIRALHKLNPDIGIIAMSGLEEKYHVGLDTKNMIRAFLQKPYTIDKLLFALEDIIKT